MASSLQRKFSCPIELTLEIVTGKWKPVILGQLKQGSLHYSELRARIPTLSDKVLTQRLRDLEELGLVLRHKRGAGGSRSRYELTPRGESLRPVLQALYDWGELIAAEVGAFIEPAQHRQNRLVSARVSHSRQRAQARPEVSGR